MEVEKRPVNGFGIASLVFGIVGILTICGCGIGFFFGLVGVIFGILGLTVLKRSGKGLAIAGVIVSGIALIFGTGWMILYLPKHKSNNTSNNYATTSTQNTSSSSNSSSSSSGNNKPETFNYSTSSEDLEKDKEELKESWNSVKEEFKDVFNEAYEEAKKEVQENSSSTSSSSESSTTSSSSSSSGKVTPELKEFCDSYEAYMDQYIELLNSVDSSTPEFMMEYAEMLEKMADLEEKADYYYSIEDTMSDADYAYFTACMLRIDAKLMKYSITEY